MALAIGEIVFRRVYQADLSRLRLHGPKDVSFARLVKHNLGISRASLWRSVAIYELSLRFPQLHDSKHLGISHVRAVLGLPARAQERLLTRAEREQLDVGVLEKQAACSRQGNGGRPPKHKLIKTIDALMRVVGVPVACFSDERAVAAMKQDEIECALAMLEDLDGRMSELRALLRRTAASRGDVGERRLRSAS